MHQHRARRVKDADVHRLYVEIDSAIVPMLSVVESHSALLLRGYAQCPCAEPTQLVGAGGGLNKNHRAGAVGAILAMGRRGSARTLGSICEASYEFEDPRIDRVFEHRLRCWLRICSERPAVR